MKKRFTPILGLLLMLCVQSQAQSFESATDAVKNMGVGWNLGNTLDAVKEGVAEGWTWDSIEDHEKNWGQPVTTPELMKMMKEAGFGAIRVPVTWYQEMDSEGKVNDAWMNRVKEVVDYVIDNDMYCIINVHHDTGDGTQWLHASTTTYDKVKDKYEYLWKQIAEKFKDYDQHLLFESYNEMLDDNNRWNEPASDDGYKAINSYAKLFVTTVRNTGGNNAERNLVVNDYSASSAPNAMKALELPEESGHIIFQLHSYPNWQTKSNAKNEIDNLISNIKTNLLDRAPVIIGEYATFTTWPSTIDYYDKDKEVALYAMDYLIKETKKEGIGTFYWMGLSDRIYRSEPAFNQADLAETLIKAYYGSSDNYKFPTHDSSKGTVAFEGEKTLEWGVGITVPASMLKEVGKQVEVELSYKLDFTDYDDIQFMYNKGGWQKIPSGLSMDGQAFDGADFGPSGAYGISSGDSKTSVLAFDDSAFELVASNDLIIQGHGVIMTKVVVQSPGTSGISNAIIDKNSDNAIFNLAGQRVANPTKGIYIQNGKKIVMK
jgi:hypothetical protein